MVSHDEHDLTLAGLPCDVLRLEKISNMLRDFFKAIAVLGDRNSPKRSSRHVALVLYRKHVPFPKDLGLVLVTRFTRFLCSQHYFQNANLAGSNSGIRSADKFELRFQPSIVPMWEQIVDARKAVASKPGRLVEGPERNLMNGMIVVQMWVDVGDFVEAESSEAVMHPPPPYPGGGIDEPPACEEEREIRKMRGT